MVSVFGTTWRLLAFLAAALGLTSPGLGWRALASPDPGGGQDQPIVNPTGRVLEMAVPLNYRKFYLGDLQVRIRPDQHVEAPRGPLLAAVKPLLRAEAFAVLNAAGGSGSGGGDAAFLDLQDLRDRGFDFRFDPGVVSILFNPTLDQKVQGNISIQERGVQANSPNAAQPADLAAFLNLRSAVDYIGHSPSGDEGLKAPRLGLEGAVRWKGFVLEAEGSYEPDDASLFGEAGDGFKRRGTRLIRDFEDQAVRASIGDIYPAGASFQYRPDLLGISIERSYSKLQPGRNTRATSRRSFRLERPSSVDVQVNGVIVRRLRLDPGDYNLGDLPIGAGLSDVTLFIEDDVGKKEKLDFSIFLDNELLEPGISEWAFAAGMPAGFENGEPDYSASDVFLTGYYRRGLSESVTGEAHLQGDRDTLMGGLSLLVGSPIGLFSLEGAASVEAGGRVGAAFEGDYALADIKDSASRRQSFRLSAKARTPDFTPPLPKSNLSDAAARSAQSNWLDLTASYGRELPFGVMASLSAGYGFGFAAEGDSYHADLTLSRPLGSDFSLGLSGGYYVREGEEDDLSLMVRLQYRPDPRSALSAVYDARHERSSLAYTSQSGQGVGSWQTSIDVSHEMGRGGGDESEMSVNGSIHYTGNRANVSLTQDTRLSGLDVADVDQRTSLRVETALAFADGHFAVGRPVSNGFAIVAPYAGLAGHEISLGKRDYGYAAQTDFLGPALLPSVSPYTLNRVDYDVADLPPGYDLGDGLFDLAPKHKSGYALKVGSEYTVTAVGTLIGADDKPLALLTGAVTEEVHPEKKVELFTNRAGRFNAQGLAPGRWIIEMATEPKLRFELTIPRETVGLYRAETLRPLRGG
jgi:outer membrane usher protein